MAFRSPTADAGRGISGVGKRVVIAASTATLFLGSTACSTGGSAKTDDQLPNDALSKIDACTIIKPEKAIQAGLPTRGTPDNTFDAEPGCTYRGDFLGIAVYRISGDTLDEYGKRSVWTDFKRIQINGRDAAEAHQVGGTDQDCTTAISAGGGVITVSSSPADPRKPFDACAESLKVAKLIEPELPK